VNRHVICQRRRGITGGSNHPTSTTSVSRRVFSTIPGLVKRSEAQRGRGERKLPTRGWASLTPAERDVVRLVREGLGNKDIAARLFVSPRTVQTHLTHVYTKLGLTSRVQLVQEAARHA
jgi:DNA-binding CsgD family transcriptional regulator